VATRQDINLLWDTLLGAYPYYTRELTAKQLMEQNGLWAELLADVPMESLRLAARVHIANNKFFPALSELRTAALAHLAPQRESALEAWGTVLELMRPGAYWPGKYAELDDDGKLVHGGELPTFANPITATVVRALGGFEALQITTERGDEVSNRARFLEAYEQLARREQDDALMLPEAQERQKLRESKVAGLIGRVVYQLTDGIGATPEVLARVAERNGAQEAA
jgi:hypothetical protein